MKPIETLALLVQGMKVASDGVEAPRTKVVDASDRTSDSDLLTDTPDTRAWRPPRPR